MALPGIIYIEIRLILIDYLNLYRVIYRNLPRKWSKLSYPGMKYVPEAEEPNAGTI